MISDKFLEVKNSVKPLKNLTKTIEFEPVPYLIIEKAILSNELEKKLKSINIVILDDVLNNTDRIDKYFDDYGEDKKTYPFGIFLFSQSFYLIHKDRILQLYFNNPRGEFQILFLQETENFYPEEIRDYIYATIPLPHSEQSFSFYDKLIKNTIHGLKTTIENFKLEARVELAHQDLERIIRTGQVLATEKNFDIILKTILHEAMEMVHADGGSIYLVEIDENNPKRKFLRFKTSALELKQDEFLLPLSPESIAGFVALSGEPLVIDDVYALDGNEPYRFNPEYDIQHNYLTRSMLVIPMKNAYDEVIGVIQLINKRLDPYRKLTYEEMQNGEVLTFTAECLKKIHALAGQAAVAIENYRLIQSIHNLLEGFVKASVLAIEQRDPTTSGHSFRVAEYTLALANAVNRTHTGKYRNLFFNDEQLREIRYAALLHDFGKVGVREKVLVKEKKLYPEQLQDIRWRFKYAMRSLEYEYSQKKIEYLKQKCIHGFSEYEKFLDFELRIRMEELREMLHLIESANEPSEMEQEIFHDLKTISSTRLHIRNHQGDETIEFLKENELMSLLVRRGNLNQQERLEIESHVSHTYRFLIQIPWTKDLKKVPDIAHAHHEKLDGSGYPMGLKENEILPQTRMLTIADIYDALTAPDRPYKRSLTPEEALDILVYEAKEGRIDDELLKIFIEAKIYEIPVASKIPRA